MISKRDIDTAETSETRLDSWKKIAAYLNRDVRTAYRWEKTEGLPVHRHQHASRSSVYAYASEIDAWVSQRTPNLYQHAGREAEAAAIRSYLSGMLVFADQDHHVAAQLRAR
jgi:predicted DNA-binding transcriptional regulator AlpA